MNKLHIHKRRCTSCSECVRKCVWWCTQHLYNILLNTCACMVLRKPAWMHITLSATKCTCTHACVPMQKCRNSFDMETIANLSWVLRKQRAGCHLPSPNCCLDQLLASPSTGPDAVRSRNPSNSMLAHDEVAAAVLYKHHSVSAKVQDSSGWEEMLFIGIQMEDQVWSPASSLSMVCARALALTSFSTRFYFHHFWCGLPVIWSHCQQVYGLWGWQDRLVGNLKI